MVCEASVKKLFIIKWQLITEALGAVTGQSSTSFQYTKSNTANIEKGVKYTFYIVDLNLVSNW